MALNPRQRLFVAEYCKDFNATEAAIRAGYSPRTAYSQGHRLLKKDEIQAAIRDHIDKALGDEKIILKAKIIDELAAIAFHQVTDDIEIVTEEIEVTDQKTGMTGIEKVQRIRFSDTGDSANRRAIAGIKRTEAGNIEIKYHSKPVALEKLGKYLDLFSDKQDINLNVKFPNLEIIPIKSEPTANE